MGRGELEESVLKSIEWQRRERVQRASGLCLRLAVVQAIELAVCGVAKAGYGDDVCSYADGRWQMPCGAAQMVLPNRANRAFFIFSDSVSL